jgi:hypothetical protein
MTFAAASCSQPLHLNDAAAAAAASTVEWYVAYDSFASNRNAEQRRANTTHGNKVTQADPLRTHCAPRTHIAAASTHW